MDPQVNEPAAQAQAVSIAPPAIGTGLSRLLYRSWESEYLGYHIRVERRVLLVRLFLNGEVVDWRLMTPRRNPEVPIVSAHLNCSRTEVIMVEAFLRGFKMKITARGRQIGGDASPF